MKQPKILFYDIETTPNLGYVWGKFEQNVLSFVKEKELLSFAYSWLGSNETICHTRANKRTDKALVAKLASLINEADIIVGHNGDNFDKKVLKARMLYWGMRPLNITASVDTLKASRSYFNFNGNSLNDLVKFLKIGAKVATPGIDLWLGCMKNDKAAWAKMAEYNVHDVVLLKKLYKRLAPWIENHPSISKLLKPGSTFRECPQCLSKDVGKQGIRPTAAGAMQKWGCKACGKMFTTRIIKGVK